MRISAALIALGTLLATALPATADSGCASVGATMYLGGFPAEGRHEGFYWALEESGSTTFTIKRGGDTCDDQTATVDYRTEDRSASSPTDYTAVSETSLELRDPNHDALPHEQTVSVPIIEDALQETVEKFQIVLFDPVGASLGLPSEAPVYIIDSSGETRFSFGEAGYSRLEGGTLLIPVFRSGDAATDATVNVGVGPGGTTHASPADYSVAPSTLIFEAGDRVETLAVSLAKDQKFESPEQLDISLSGDQVVSPSATTVTIEDANQNLILPTSKLHHPRHRHTYGPDYERYGWLREIHIFTNLDQESSLPVERVEFALRKKNVSGACAWWTGDGFASGACDTKKWVRRGFDKSFGFWTYYLETRLRPSMGTNIENYTAYSRAIDEAGNREATFDRRRNANTFEVAPRK